MIFSYFRFYFKFFKFSSHLADFRSPSVLLHLNLVLPAPVQAANHQITNKVAKKCRKYVKSEKSNALWPIKILQDRIAPARDVKKENCPTNVDEKKRQKSDQGEEWIWITNLTQNCFENDQNHDVGARHVNEPGNFQNWSEKFEIEAKISKLKRK